MITLRAFDAGAGDSILVSTGGAAVLVDGGEAGAFDRHIAGALATGPPLDLVMVTHWDGDHILGIRNLYRSPALAAIRAPEVRFNHFTGLENRLDGQPSISTVEDGADLVSLLRTQNVTVRGAVAGEEIRLDDLVLTVLGPGEDLLAEAEAEWHEQMAALSGEASPFLAAMAAVQQDDSPSNRASITVLVGEPGGPPLALLTGDTTGPDLIEQLQRGGIIGSWGCLHVPVIKVQHHASERNVDADFLARVTADHYVISANGRHQNPDPAVIDGIVDAAARCGGAVWFTSEGRTTNQRSRIAAARARVAAAGVRIGNAPNAPVEIELS